MDINSKRVSYDLLGISYHNSWYLTRSCSMNLHDKAILSIFRNFIQHPMGFDFLAYYDWFMKVVLKNSLHYCNALFINYFDSSTGTMSLQMKIKKKEEASYKEIALKRELNTNIVPQSLCLRNLDVQKKNIQQSQLRNNRNLELLGLRWQSLRW